MKHARNSFVKGTEHWRTSPNCCKLMQFNICTSDLIPVHFVSMQDALLQHVKHALLCNGNCEI